MPKRKLYKGQTFNRLTILEDGDWNTKVLCQCSCGKQKRILRNNVTKGHTKSCGCANFGHQRGYKHGLYNTPIWKHWRSMIARCHSGDPLRWRHYGNVTVCERWWNFENFYSDMADSYFEGAELDKDKYARPCSPKTYSKETCCWLSKKENMIMANSR